MASFLVSFHNKYGRLSHTVAYANSPKSAREQITIEYVPLGGRVFVQNFINLELFTPEELSTFNRRVEGYLNALRDNKLK